MAIELVYPLVNGHRYSFASIEASAPTLGLTALSLTGLTAINYGDALRGSSVHGTSSKKIGRTKGQQEPKGDLEMLRLEFEVFKERIKLQSGGRGYGEIPWDFVVQYGELGQPTVTDMLVACRIQEVDLSNQDNPDPSKVKLTLDPMDVQLNGDSIATDPFLII